MTISSEKDMEAPTTSETLLSNRVGYIKAICEELDENSLRRNDNDCRYMFITFHSLEKIWTIERLGEFFKGFPWADKKFLEVVLQKFLRVLSILVRIEWDGFENFKDAFYDHPGRQDSDLPFHDTNQIEQLDPIIANNFSTRQYNFIPITIEENKDQEVSESRLFPFVKESEVISEEKGSDCIVYKEVVAKRHLITSSGEPNADETLIVRKSCALSKAHRVVEGEVQALAKFRSLPFNNERIMPSLCVIIHGYTLDILFPFADLDLEDLISENPKSKLVSSASPKYLIIELAGLADALGYLHSELCTTDGESLVCVHNDIKPENVLIFCGLDAPVGRWKIWRFRSSKLQEGERLPSLTVPKRGPGSFQAPEVERQGEKVIGPESDVFSLGCISSRIVTYAIGGAKLVQDFDRKRGRESQHEDGSISHGHDFYHRNEGREINVEVLTWLNELDRGKGERSPWIQACVEIIKSMLEIDPQKRPKAHAVKLHYRNKVLPKIEPKAERKIEPDIEPDIGSPTGEPVNESSTDTESLCDSNTPMSPLQGGITKTEEDQAPPPTPPPEPVALPPALYNDRRLRLHSYSFSKAKLLDHEVTQTALSSFHEYIAYLSPYSVRVIDLALLDQKNYWAEREDVEKLISDESTFLDIRAPDIAFWRAMALSQDYLALRTADAIYLHKLKKSPDCKIKNSCIFERSKFEHQLLAVAVSVKGDLILQFEDFLEIYVQSESWKSHILEICGTLQSAVFDMNGDWIVAWSLDKGSLYSYFWQVGDLSQTHRGDISRPRHKNPCALSKQILACDGPHRFVAWDEPHGQVRIIHGLPPSQEEAISKECLYNIITGIVTPAADAIVFIRKSCNNSNINDQVSIVPLSLNRDNIPEMGKSFDICKTKAPITNSCGITVTVDEQSKVVKHILVAHLDGFIEKIELVYDKLWDDDFGF